MRPCLGRIIQWDTGRVTRIRSHERVGTWVVADGSTTSGVPQLRLIVVGRLDPQEAEASIRKYFDSWEYKGKGGYEIITSEEADGTKFSHGIPE